MKFKNEYWVIIPARSGSKSIINKNIQLINNKPLIYYPIEAAIKSRVCDKICVSTDSPKIQATLWRWRPLSLVVVR